MKRTGIVLSALTALAFLLRVWHLGTVPPGLDADEASIGYNAYSLLVTGRDEFGVPHRHHHRPQQVTFLIPGNAGAAAPGFTDAPRAG